MPRARSIKPGFFKNELLAQLPCQTRLLFIGLWTLADRAGRLEDRPMRIRIEIFPYDQVDIDPMLQALADQGFIDRYQSGGVRVISIANFGKHQSPHVKELASTLPAPDKTGADTSAKHLTPDSPFSDSLPPDNRKPVPVFSREDFEPTETEPGYWAERLYSRHPKKKDLPLVSAECLRIWTTKNGSALSFFREIDRIHGLWCTSEGWVKENGRYAPKLAEWLGDRGWTKEPEAEKGFMDD